MVGIARRNWGNLALIAIAVACSGHVEERGGGQTSGGRGGSVGNGVEGSAGDAGRSSFGGTHFGGTHFGGTGAGGTGTGGAVGFANGGAVGFANGGLGGFGNAGFGGGGVGGTDGPDSCFGAGTPIATPSGTRPIEELKLGDLVLDGNLAPALRLRMRVPAGAHAEQQRLFHRCTRRRPLRE